MGAEILLPRQPRRCDLRAFWLVACGLAGLAVGLPLAWLLSPVWFLAAALAAGGLAAAGYRRPYAVKGAYRAWNQAAATFAARARTLILRVYWHAVVRAAGRSGAADRELRLEPPGGTLWAPRGTQPARQYASPSLMRAEAAASPPGAGSAGWRRAYVHWARDGGGPWALALLPLLVLLRALGARPPVRAPEGIYTLY